ncbi:AsnC family transcriptional regulator [Sphingopyxis sp. H038]|jgi:Lrp/AsnC family transcriptional regulator for asnA, asnC and gidA|uniref:Lrp/AsnC family transcriptional regulator n=1 Tax=unclassified Sphingopyxis TaxID=2614943 RepID=UPI000731CB6D|nr:MULTISPECIES: Lrp/AsnC family transcriptional regulator [unclassified Sphingopyxis]KTE00923.1 AsnC family transcriptional regulator [Sphingopyxis sp. H012]KTE08714.1 AsnC family transcriptional regulator [Sphingopyxis sp. H053]KTE10239.1 AsnC family transcriptional regulator [Sphingopyxis sp. H093]KTE28380.1 AsnC family transcriptional regulator [Sphingopyxis sp. H080]KTE32315.1 AsnC family transcriptional regulator [Sphingopyxis sp. H038]
MSTRISLDELDHKIIERLGHDARVSNREIGREFDLTEGTIRSRLKRLLDNRVIRVAAVTNANRLRNPILAYLWVEADTAADIEKVAESLAQLPEIGFVATTLGRADVLAMTLVENGNELTDFLHQTIDKIPGVRRVRYSLGQNFIKHDYRWCALVD